MAIGDQVSVPNGGYIDAEVDPQSPDARIGAANAFEVAEGPDPAVVVFECQSDGKKRRFTNLRVGMGWTSLTITKIYGAAEGTTATAVRLRWGNS